MTALEEVDTQFAIILPVDMPLIEPQDLLRLLSGVRQFSTHLASYSILDRWVTTLLFAINVESSGPILNKLKSINASRSSSIFRAMPSTILFECNSSLSQLHNVNTPQDLEALKECQRIDSFSHVIFKGSKDFFSTQHWLNTPPDHVEQVIDTVRKELQICGIKKIQLDVLKDIRRIIGTHQYEVLGFAKQESRIYTSLDLNI